MYDRISVSLGLSGQWNDDSKSTIPTYMIVPFLLQLLVDLPPDSSSISPPPLEEAVPLDLYQRCMSPTPTSLSEEQVHNISYNQVVHNIYLLGVVLRPFWLFFFLQKKEQLEEAVDGKLTIADGGLFVNGL